MQGRIHSRSSCLSIICKYSSVWYMAWTIGGLLGSHPKNGDLIQLGSSQLRLHLTMLAGVIWVRSTSLQSLFSRRLSTKILTISRWPALAATCKGVVPSLHLLTSAGKSNGFGILSSIIRKILKDKKTFLRHSFHKSRVDYLIYLK